MVSDNDHVKKPLTYYEIKDWYKCYLQNSNQLRIQLHPSSNNIIIPLRNSAQLPIPELKINYDYAYVLRIDQNGHFTTRAVRYYRSARA